MTNMEKIRLCQEIVDQIQAESQRPVCRLHLSREPFAVSDSHLGGVPYVPRNGQIPVDDDGNQLWLCAQINFAQMPPVKGFPTEGILQFFLSDFDRDGGFGIYSSEDGIAQGDWRTAFYPTVDASVTEGECLAKMAVPWEEASKEHMPRPAHKFDLRDIEEGHTFLWRCPDRPLKMSFLPVEQEGVNHEDYRFDILFAAALKARFPEEDPEEFMPYKLDAGTPEEREARAKVWKQIERGGCKTGGYPRYYQDDPRLYSEEHGIPLEEWDILLFQLDDDPFTYPAGKIGEELGEMDVPLNGGTMNFLIRPEDLEKRDFSRVLAQWACT